MSSTLNWKIKPLPNSELEIVGEISADDFESSRSEALKRLNKETTLAGFRPGHIPERVLLEKLGHTPILEKMARIVLDRFYHQFLKEKTIETIGIPAITITKLAPGKPLEFKLTTAVLPPIILGNYRALIQPLVTATPELIMVTEKEIEDVVKGLEQTDPEKLNTENLREKIKHSIEQHKKHRAEDKKRLAIMEKILVSLDLPLPPLLVDHELSRTVAEMRNDIKRLGTTFTDYLNHIKKTEIGFRESLRDQAVKRIKINLVLEKIATDEKLKTVTEVWQFLEKPV